MKTDHRSIQELVQKAVQRINNGVSKTLTARLQTEVPPLDPRHLTDTRTRVSTLLEYALAYELNHLLIEEKNGCSASSVLWNVFPDLLLRNEHRIPVVGLEVKALHTAAEEKSAHLSTPLHIIQKGRDFVVILIWAWKRDSTAGVTITYPHIHAAEMFDAYCLAQARDYSWLFNQGNRRKGIDLSTPLITPESDLKGESFKAEESNMGKLMRISLETSLPSETPALHEIRLEMDRYENFKAYILRLGLSETFREICDLQQANSVAIDSPRHYPEVLTQVGSAVLKDGRLIFLFAGGSPSRFGKPDDATFPSGSLAIWLSSRLKWTVLRVSEGEWATVANGEKPDTAYAKIAAAIESQG
jgi:hypothetical protein